MQHRMREFQMTEPAVQSLLDRCPVMILSTTGADGFPYGVPVHTLWLDGKLYFHGLPQGEKLANIARDPRVCLTGADFRGILSEGVSSPCDADAAYECVVVRGHAALVSGPEKKRRILAAIVHKLAPELDALPLAEARVAGTAVVEVTPVSVTGKYHE